MATTVATLAVVALMVDGMVQRAVVERKALEVDRRHTARAVALANVAAVMSLRYADTQQHEGALRTALQEACTVNPSIARIAVGFARDDRVPVNTASEDAIAGALATGDESNRAGPLARNARAFARLIVAERRTRPFQRHRELVGLLATLEPVLSGRRRDGAASAIFARLKMGHSAPGTNLGAGASIGLSQVQAERGVLVQLQLGHINEAGSRNFLAEIARGPDRRSRDVRRWEPMIERAAVRTTTIIDCLNGRPPARS